MGSIEAASDLRLLNVPTYPGSIIGEAGDLVAGFEA
jgi:hypothetical protein